MTAPTGPGRLTKGWTLLESQVAGGHDRIRTYDIDLRIGQGPILTAVDRSMRRHLLVPLSRKQRIGRTADGANISIGELSLEDKTSFVRYADVCCENPRYHDLFTDLCRDILDAINSTPTRAIAAMNSVVRKWRGLFSTPDGVLPRSARIGLAGELITLLELLERSPSSVMTWAGPLSARHDFTTSAIALEVKTAIAGTARTTRVHGIDQLAPPSGGQLFLRYLEVDEVESGPAGDALPDLVARAEQATDDPPELMSRLTAAGYSAAHAELYSVTRYKIVSDSWYTVRDGFPRLTRDQFADPADADGIVDVSYSIALPTGHDFRTDPEYVLDQLVASHLEEDR
ncbi:PD-(D/E)XK motif protein [Tomitella fengzijianii]|uniref:PD-(D/E)XK motif protein n=1 Tax=Tomitella fengzijianii TaxID=2597660 RepID=A0A516WZR2_9ACTN|nr:PD-(D/E)XK motif protein [Tomitella fengzijianii]QDQ96344.1 PD-(D/E)XK motif protein [Tomitella fengzijianii]